MQSSKLILLISLLAFSLSASPSEARLYTKKLPLYLTFEANREMPLNFSVLIKRHRNYNLSLAVKFRDQDERVLARSVVGDWATHCDERHDCGEKSSFKITVRSDKGIIFSGVKAGAGHYAFGQDSFWRKVLDISLRPGVYDFTIETVELGARFSSVATEWVFNTPSNASDLSD